MAFGVDDAISLAGIGAELFGGLKSNSSAKKAAAAQMQFQLTSMQNRHKWEVDDLRRAGLNPILSANSGAPALSGASYTPTNAAAGAASSATNAVNSSSQRKLMAEQLLATNASAKASLATADNQSAQARLNSVNAVNNAQLTPGLEFQAAIDNVKRSAAKPVLDRVSGTAGYLSSDVANKGVGSLDQMIRHLNSLRLQSLLLHPRHYLAVNMVMVVVQNERF